MLTKTITGLWQKFLTDSLFRNSLYLMMSTGILGVLGFVFWIECSHLYGPDDIGMATSLIAGVSLVSTLSAFGLTNTIIRFLAGTARKNEQLSTALIITTIASILFSAAFIAWATVTHNPDFAHGRLVTVSVFFTLYVLVLSINSIIDSAFVAYRASKYVFYRNAITSVAKLILPILIIGFGFLSVFSSILLAACVALIVGAYWLVQAFKFTPSWKIDTETVQETFQFTLANYLGTLFGMMPSTIVPIIIVTRLGPEAAAFFYMPLMIINFLNIIPSASAQSLFAELAHDGADLVKYLRRSLRQLFIMIVPGAIGAALLGPVVLRIIGKAYAEGGSLTLYILILASIVGALNYFGDTLLNIRKYTRMYVAMNALNAFTIVISAYYFAPNGLAAVALAWLVGQIVTLIVYLAINWKLVTELYA